MKMGMEQWRNYTDNGKLKYWEKNLSQCGTLSITDFTWIDLRSMLGHRHDRHGMA
jgi:hypothetical protein